MLNIDAAKNYLIGQKKKKSCTMGTGIFYLFILFLFIYFLSQTIVCNRFNSLKSDCLKYICGHFDHLIVASGYII